MILINKVEVHNFTAIVTGNGGEEQLVIISSPLRMGKEDLIIASATVQGGARLIRNTQVGSGALMVIERALVEWCASGTKGQMGIEHAKGISMVLTTLQREWEYD